MRRGSWLGVGVFNAREIKPGRQSAQRKSTHSNNVEESGSWIATGFSAWGLALGTAGALDVVHRILGEPTRIGSWSPRRASLARHPRTSLRVTARTAANLASSMAPWTGNDEAAPSPGQGVVVRERGEHVAVSRDAHGVVRAVSARCTHLRCLVSWNAEAVSWDCECHGSRFAPLWHGPARAGY